MAKIRAKAERLINSMPYMRLVPLLPTNSVIDWIKKITPKLKADNPKINIP
jgi:hypothetical protein